jgi:putative hydrolase
VNGGAQPGDERGDDYEPVDPPGGPLFNPLEALAGMDFQDLFRMLQTPGPVNWEIARECASSIASADPETGEAAPERPVDAKSAEQLTDLVRVAQTHVAGITGLTEVGAVRVRAVTREQWAGITLDGLRPVIDALSTTLTGGVPPPIDPSLFAGNPLEAAAEHPELFAGIIGAIAPLLFGVQAGSLVGLLAQHALGQHDLPLPLAGEPQLAFVIDNIDRFAKDWEIESRDLHFALALREVVRCAPRSVGWVRDRLVKLSSQYVSGYEMRPEVIEEKLAGLLPEGLDLSDFDLAGFDPATFNPLDPSTMPDLPAINIDPTALLDGLRSPAQDPVLVELQRFGCVLEGYADTVVAELSNTLSPGTLRVDEALRRHRVEHGRHTEFVEKMLGIALDRAHYEAGAAFCAGVVERSGIEGLNRLWERESMLPTSNELAAPGLWLARIDLDLG